MKLQIYIYSLFLVLSFMHGQSLNLVTDISMLRKEKNNSIDEQIERFWIENKGDFSSLPMTTVSFDKIQSGSKKNKIKMNDKTYFKGSVVHSNRLTFTENQLVDIYTMFNVLYSIQSHKGQYVVDPNEMYFRNHSQKPGNKFYNIYLKNKYVPEVTIPTRPPYYLWISTGITFTSLVYSFVVYNQYDSAQTTDEASALRHKSQISNKVFTISIFTTLHALYKRYKSENLK